MDTLRTRRPLAALAIAVAISLALRTTATAQDAAVQYVYDELSRLNTVVDQQGNVAVYTYDATGNVLRIDRVNANDIPGPLGITLVRPNRGKVGTAVEILGKGFNTTISSNTVRFNGTTAVVTDAAPNRLRTTVPSGATTGPITVTVGSNTAASLTPFTVLSVAGPLTISPLVATVVASGIQPFQALLNGTPTTNVTWAVGGIPGGSPPVGTISPIGVYTAPPGPQFALSVVVSATHRDDPALTASAPVVILGALPTFVDTAMLSVTVGAPAQQSIQSVTGNVSVALADPSQKHVTGHASVNVAPVITGVSPSTVARGSTGVQLTLTGSGFTGATGLSFLLNAGVPADSNLTITNLQITGDGSATAQLSVASQAPTGARVVRITTPTRTSTSAGTAANILTVQ